MKNGTVYLGDGLYAHYDGYQVTLYADRGGSHHYVCLEPEVIQAFIRYLEKTFDVTITMKPKEQDG
jgi:hypothetical protein